MPTSDLLERARSAVTVEEECAVVWEACAKLATHGPRYGEGRPALQKLVASVNNGDLPRPVLLGVVAALVPAKHRVIIDKRPFADAGRPDGYRAVICREACPAPMPESSWAASAALALLIAILEASHAD